MANVHGAEECPYIAPRGLKSRTYLDGQTDGHCTLPCLQRTSGRCGLAETGAVCQWPHGAVL